MRDAADGRAFAVAVWILLAAVAVAGIAGVLGGILSSALVPDLIALWPLLAVALAVGVLGRWLARRRGGRSRAILPLTLFSAVVLAASLHLGGWEELPSAEARLTGPPAASGEVAELVVQMSAEIRVRPSTGRSAYRVDPILRGGLAGVPEATETSTDDDLSIVLSAASDPPSWYSFAGWNVFLSPEVRWRLVLNGRLDADLGDLDLSSAVLAGSGVVDLGHPPVEGGSVIVAGDLDLVVPADAGVVVDGPATVPPSWESTERSARSPAADDDGRWSISVQGDADVTVVEG